MQVYEYWALQSFFLRRQNSPPFSVLELRLKLVSCARYCLIPYINHYLTIVPMAQEKVVTIYMKCVLSRRPLRKSDSVCNPILC